MMNKLTLNGRIWMETSSDEVTERFMDIDRMELLGHIQRIGSISQAAKAMHMSYKRAWMLVHSMNEQSACPLVTTQIGGEKGGGTVVTAEGEKYLTQYQAIQDRFQQFLREEMARQQR